MSPNTAPTPKNISHHLWRLLAARRDLIAVVANRDGVALQTRRVGAPPIFDATGLTHHLFMTRFNADMATAQLRAAIDYGHYSHLKTAFHYGRQVVPQTLHFYPLLRTTGVLIMQRIF